MISGIYKRGNSPPPTGSEAERRNREAFAQAWQKMGLVVLYPEWIFNDFDRQHVINQAVKLYGERDGQE